MSTALGVEGLSVDYGGVRAVDDVSITVEAGAVVGLMGPNGAGKTTVLNAVAGLVRPSAGRTLVGKRDISRLRPFKRARAGVAVASQRPRPFDDLTVAEHLRLAANHCGGGPDADLDAVLERCALAGVADQLPANLTPSQLRRLELARALAGSPSVLLLDEVGAGLPAEDIDHIAAAVIAAAGEGRGVLVVDHVMELLLAVAHRLVVLDLGRVIADGDPQEVIANPRVMRAYFGTRET